MGNDGGSIAKRSEILRRFGAELETNSDFQLGKRDLTCCAMTGKPFREGDVVVSDFLGLVYLKASVLGHLLERKRQKNISNNKFQHIRTMNDVVELSGLPETFEGYLVPCGCLLESLSALDSDLQQCPKCKARVDLKRDVVLLMADSRSNKDRGLRLKVEKIHHNNRPLKRKTKTAAAIQKK